MIAYQLAAAMAQWREQAGRGIEAQQRAQQGLSRVINTKLAASFGTIGESAEGHGTLSPCRTMLTVRGAYVNPSRDGESFIELPDTSRLVLAA